MAGSPSGGEYDRKEQWGGEFHAAGERATNGIPNESARIGWTRKKERERVDRRRHRGVEVTSQPLKRGENLGDLPGPLKRAGRPTRLPSN